MYHPSISLVRDFSEHSVCTVDTLGKIMGQFGENLTILRKKWERFGKNTQFSRNFPMIFPSLGNKKKKKRGHG